ncbi:Negative modulator of initiation of replication [Usitatibacter rugosus]|uniref:Negative modulator of initiation of replication n=1 Tax=Usitatibacter rugosus TaxID=2732067 RepID=A0A6M4GRU6_9PROT|nr:hypothetical protein [Usitatibacter rugosus]QJR09842.1 Negative modulator of initiation of replication [Usitatibacter rugosus]
MPRTRRYPSKMVFLEEDVYWYLLSRATAFEDEPSAILRRLLRIGARESRVARVARVAGAAGVAGVASPRKRVEHRHELAAAIGGAPWYPFDVQRYLFLLRCIRDARPKDFGRVLQVGGKSRRYFAKSAREIEASGNATHPQAIAGTGYWTLTNLPTRDKERVLRNVMTILDFEEEAMLAAREYLLRGRIPAATL